MGGGQGGQGGRGWGLRGNPPTIFFGGNYLLISAFFGDTPPQDQTSEYGQHLAGMHPTGMHSCLESKSSLPPTMKLGQGYIFTGVCDSVHRGACMAGGMCAQGGMHGQGGMCGLGHAWQGWHVWWGDM